MKKTLLLTTALMVLAVPALAGDGAWFDFGNCQVCKHMAAEPDFMANVGWENHVLKNGWMNVTVVPADYQEKFDAVHTSMQQAGMQAMAADDAHLCGFCNNFMTLMGSGKVQIQEFQTIGGKVSLMTSDDAETVAALQKHAKKTIKAMDAMKSEMDASE